MTAPAPGPGGAGRVRAAAGKPQQWFHFGPWAFDVTAAAGLLRAAPRPPRQLAAGAWARAYGLLPEPGGSPDAIPLIGPGPDFDPVYAMTTDLDEPVIVTSVTAGGTGEPYPLLIDGCHRLYKAVRAGREHLPSLLLTAAETMAVRHDAVLGPSRSLARGRAWRTGDQP
jgi:hypothetical protein